VTLVVVVAHLARCGSYVTNSSLDLDVGLGGRRRVGRGRRLLELDLATGILLASVRRSGLRLVRAVVRNVDGVSRLVVVGGGRLLVATVVRDVDFVSGRGPATVLSLSDVELVLDGLVVDLGAFLEADRGFAVVGVAIGEERKKRKEESARGVPHNKKGKGKEKKGSCKHINKNTSSPVTAHWGKWSLVLS
jgi:hypothetical protein